MTDKRIKIIPGFRGYSQGSLCYQTGSNPLNSLDMSHHVFEDVYHDIPLGPAAIKLFFERLVLGDNLPNEMIVSNLNSVDTAFAAAMFANPNLVLQSECASLVYSTEIFRRWGDAGTAHIPTLHKEVLLSATKALKGEDTDSLEKLYQRLYVAMGVFENYLITGSIEITEMPENSYEVLYDTGSFIAFESVSAPMEDIYRQGYLAGIWFEICEDTYRPHIFKKSHLVNMDLGLIGEALNVEEFGVKGKSTGWLENGLNVTILHCPTKDLTTGNAMVGTKLSKERVLELVLSFL